MRMGGVWSVDKQDAYTAAAARSAFMTEGSKRVQRQTRRAPNA